MFQELKVSGKGFSIPLDVRFQLRCVAEKVPIGHSKVILSLSFTWTIVELISVQRNRLKFIGCTMTDNDILLTVESCRFVYI